MKSQEYTEEHESLLPEQVFLRVLAIICASIGAATCAYSLMLQISDTGNLLATLTWFTGLFGLTLALASYACSADFQKNNNYIIQSVVIGAILTIAIYVFMNYFIYSSQVIIIAAISMLVQGIVLVIYHFVLRSRVLKKQQLQQN